MDPYARHRSRMRRMLFATLAMLAAVVWLAVTGDQRLFEGADDVQVRTERDAVVLAWRGEVKAPMADKIAAAFDERKSERRRFVLELDSPGGSLSEGHAVIDEIERMKRTHHVDTRIRAYDHCLSMCVPIFLRGDERTAHWTSRFMFHEPTAYDAITHEEVRQPAFERRYESDRYFRRYFEATDMNPDWGAKLKAEWEGVDVWKTGEELVEEGSNIVTRLR